MDSRLAAGKVRLENLTGSARDIEPSEAFL